MLIFEIAIGVFFGGLLLIKYNSYVKNKDEQANKKKEWDELLLQTKKYIDNSYHAKFDAYIKLFEERLLTLEDDDDVHFKDAGITEYDLFISNMDTLRNKINIELDERFYAKLNDEFFAFVNPQVNFYLDNLISVTNNKAMLLMTNKLLEINEKNTANNIQLSNP